MERSERVMLIRRGNELFNNKDYKNSLKIYLAIDYQDGIARIASVMEHEKKDRITALKLYKRAKHYSNVEKLAYQMAQAIRLMIKEDKENEALVKGENYNTGYKISGQAPTMLPHEALIRAKAALGIKPEKIHFSESDKDIVPWRPIILSKKELDDFKSK